MSTTLSHATTADLAATLVQVAHERGTYVERLRAEQLLAESRRAWPGDEQSMWSKWLAEAAKSLGFRVRAARLACDEALHLVEDGALLVCNPTGRDADILLNADGRFVELLNSSTDQRTKVTRLEFADLFRSNFAVNADDQEPRHEWLIVEDLELSHETDDVFHGRPVSRLFAILRPESSDIWVVGVFAFFAGLLSLATPIAVESLVNIVAFGQLLQPLVILSLMLFGFLAFASLMRALQTFVVEIIQRRLFARVAADLAYRFPRITKDALHDHYGPELANRFFDIVTLQKVVAQLLLDGIAIVLATVVGMAVLAFYHPWLLGFDVLLLGLIVGGVLVLGRGAIGSGIDESRQKYKIAGWFEDLMRCQLGFKSAGAAEFALDRANQLTADYLSSRRTHFKVLFRQLLFILGLQAVAGTVLLGFGGWLVIQGQLTLGQLVAAELIVATVLGSLAKLGKHIEGFYDVVAGVDKLGHLFDLRMESQDGLLVLSAGSGARLRLTEVKHPNSEPALRDGITLSMEPGDNIALLGRDTAGSTVLFDILYGLRTPQAGHVEIENADPRDVRPDILRGAVALARGVEVFEGTIAENVHLARPGVSMTDVRMALQAVGLLDCVLRMPEGLDSKLNASGGHLLTTQLHLLMLARAIAGRPRLLLIDGLLDMLGDEQMVRVCKMLHDDSQTWTLMVATNRTDVARMFSRVLDVEHPDEPLHPLFLPSPNPELDS